MSYRSSSSFAARPCCLVSAAISCRLHPLMLFPVRCRLLSLASWRHVLAVWVTDTLLIVPQRALAGADQA